MTIITLQQTAPIPGEVERNTEELLALAEQSLADCDIVVFPEMAHTGYVTGLSEIQSYAQQLDGPLVTQLSMTARKHDGLIVTGFIEHGDGEFFNTVAIISEDGPILSYRKLHLFDTEKLHFSAGEDLPTVSTKYGVLAACICYDLRFVEVLRILSLKGAELVLAPAAWVGGFDARVPHDGLVQQAQAVQVQANLDQVAVVAVSQAPNSKSEGVAPLGGSIAVDAFGTLQVGPLSRTGPDSASFSISGDDVRAARVRSPRIKPREDRRTDVYHVTYGEELL